jgi:pyrrolidone-carboxylate peptidase
MKRIWLLTSFEPFAGRTENNSQTVLGEIQKLAADLEKTKEWPFEFHYATLPVEYDRCFTVLKDEIAKSKVEYEGILSIGEGAEEFKIETQANNLDDVPNMPDNVGVNRVGKKIFADLGKTDTIALRFPFEAFQRIRTSRNPGYFICNHLCAKMGREYATDLDAPYFGFIHVPRTGLGGVFSADVCAAMIVNSFKKMTA